MAPPKDGLLNVVRGSSIEPGEPIHVEKDVIDRTTSAKALIAERAMSKIDQIAAHEVGPEESNS